MLQDPELIIHRLRLRYLSQFQDGIGERIIDFSKTKTNSPAFRIAGGDPAIIDRCVSPDIPLHDAADFTPVGMSRVDLTKKTDEPVDQDATLTKTLSKLASLQKAPRNNAAIAELQSRAKRDPEASDQSDVTDNDEALQTPVYGSYLKHLAMIDIHKRVSDEPKFQKIPVRSRQRGISDTSVNYNRLSVLPLPPRRPPISQNGSESDGFSRNGEQSVVSSDSGMILTSAQYDPSLGLQSIPPTSPILAADEFGSLADLEEANENDYSDDSDYEAQLESDQPVLHQDTEMRPSRKRNASVSSATAPTIKSLPKSQPRPESIVITSNLTSMLKAAEAAEVNPLEQRFGIMNGSGDLKPLRLKIYRPSSEAPSIPFHVVIKSSATVLDTIGYALLRYTQEGLTPALLAEQNDPNLWTLRIVEDDGELDEDFPALERTRPISKFSFDEFGLVEATPSQVNENNTTTPNPTNSKRALNSIPEGVSSDALLSSRTGSSLLTGSNGLNSTTTVSSPATSTKPTARAPGASVLLKVKLLPETLGGAAQYSQSTILDVTTETYLGDVLDQVCKRRNLDKFMFSLRLAGSNVVVPSDRTVESLGGRVELLLVRKKATDLFTDTALPRSMTPNAPIVAAAGSSARLGGLTETSGLSSFIPDIVTSNTYQRWTVWRRQPMSFMGRHERILAIDGEYVHISPSEAKTMFESPKTSSLHVGQIIACKQSRKLPINFKIIIIKAGQTKRYDFEAISVKEAETMVSKIRTLTRNFATRTGTRSSRLAS